MALILPIADTRFIFNRATQRYVYAMNPSTKKQEKTGQRHIDSQERPLTRLAGYGVIHGQIAEVALDVYDSHPVLTNLVQGTLLLVPMASMSVRGQDEYGGVGVTLSDAEVIDVAGNAVEIIEAGIAAVQRGARKDS